MKPSTRALVARALKLREATDRVALAAAQAEQARRSTAAAELEQANARERAFAASGPDPRLSGPMFDAWRLDAAARQAAAQQAVAEADAACMPRREALAETLRTAKGFATLMEREDAERARLAARRDPLQHLMSLPGRR